MLYQRKCTGALLSTVIPSPAMKRIYFGQVLVYSTHSQPAGPSTGQSTPRGRSWLGPSPILSAGFEEADSTAENLENAARRTAAGGRRAGSSLINLDIKVKRTEKLSVHLTCQRRL